MNIMKLTDKLVSFLYSDHANFCGGIDIGYYRIIDLRGVSKFRKSGFCYILM